MTTTSKLIILFSLVMICNLALASTESGNDPAYAERKALQYLNQTLNSKENSNDIVAGPVRQMPARDRQGGPDDHGYTFKDSDEDGGPEFDWIDVPELEGASQLQMGDDLNTGFLNLEFEMPFYDEVYDQIAVCSNGWASFTNTALRTYHESYFGGGEWPNQDDQMPEALLSIHMTDLNPTRAGSVWFWTNEQDQAIVSWVEVAHYRNQDNGLFTSCQIILNANGIIIFQYNDDNWPDPNLLIAIQNEDRDDGLLIVYSSENEPDDEYLYDGLAIRIAARMGTVSGTVTDVETEEPIVDALVELSDGSSTMTDEEGAFRMEEVVEDLYTATVSAYGYNTAFSEEFEVLDEENTEVNFALTHPEITFDVEDFIVDLAQQEIRDNEFAIINEGNGELEFSMRFTIPIERDAPGDLLFEWNASELTGDDRIRGIATDGVYYYLTGSNNNDDPNFIYVISQEGELIHQFEQPVEDPSRNGMRGMTCDGRDLYSPDGTVLTQFNTNGERVGEIQTPYNPVLYAAYDSESDHFWVAGTTTRLAEIDREGNVIRDHNNGLRKYGLAWHPEDPDDFKLYVLQRVRDGSQVMLSKVNTENGEVLDVLDLQMDEDDVATECLLTNAFNPLIWMFVEVVENNVSDYIRGVELELNTSWVTVDPMQGTVDPESELMVEIRFNAGNWLPGTYELILVVESNAAGDPLEIPLVLNVSDEGLEMEFYEFSVEGTVGQHNFMVSAVELRGEPAEFGDEIGVFTAGGLCTGGSIWFDQVTMVPAYGDNPDTDFDEGYEEGTPFAFRVWDSDINRDFAAIFTLTNGDERFRNEGTTRGILEVPGQVRELTYELGMGWHLISANLSMDEVDIQVLFADLVERGSLEMIKDGQGRFYRPAFDFNNIPGWVATEGYQIKMGQEDSFSLTGDALDPTTPVVLEEGWNMISYIPRWEMDARDAFGPLENNLLMAKDGIGQFFIPEWGFSNMGNVSEMNGYQLKVAEDVEFRYPQAGRLASFSTVQISEAGHFAIPRSTGQNMSLLLIFPEGEFSGEIAVMGSDQQVYGVSAMQSSGRAGMALWGDDNFTTLKDGLSLDEGFSLQAWSEDEGYFNPEYSVVAGDMNYTTDGLSVIEIFAENADVPEQLQLMRSYPNPFNDRITITYYLPDNDFAALDLFDTNGRLVKHLAGEYRVSGQYNISLYSKDLPTGTYLLQLQSGSQITRQKIVLLK